MKWMCFWSRTYLTAPSRPAPRPSPQCPAEELEAAGLISLGNWDSLSFQGRGRSGISQKSRMPGSRYRVHDCTPPDLSKAQATSTTSSERGAGCVHPLGISPSEPTGWHHPLLLAQNHRQLRKTDVLPAREILTLFNLLCLKNSPPQTRVCAGGRNKEVRQAEVPPNNDQTPSLVHFSQWYKTSNDDLVQFDTEWTPPTPEQP